VQNGRDEAGGRAWLELMEWAGHGRVAVQTAHDAVCGYGSGEVWWVW